MAAKDQYWLKSGIINILQNFSATIINIATFYILVRLFDKHDYGVWGIYMQAIIILEIVRNGLIQSALIKFMSGAKEKEHSEIISASATISGIITVLCVILTFIFANPLANILKAPELAPMFRWYTISFVLSGVLTQMNCIEQANFQYKGVFASGLVRALILLIFIVINYFFHFTTSLLVLVYVQFACVVGALIASYVYVRPFLHFKYSFNMDWVKKIFDYGKFSFATTVSSILSGTIDQWMLAGMISPVASGAFNIAVRISNLVDIPTNAIATIVFPQSSRRIETEGREAVKYLYEKSVGTILAIVIPALIFLYLFDNIIIELLAGDKYADSVPILNITLLYCILSPFGRQTGVILDSIGKTGVNFAMVIWNTSLILVLNYFFIPKYGVIGAAYATLISNSIGFITAQIVLYRELKVNALNTFIYAYRFYPEFLNKYILKK